VIPWARLLALIGPHYFKASEAWTCPGLMDTPRSAKVRAIGVDDG